jgi:hypothetical protein
MARMDRAATSVSSVPLICLCASLHAKMDVYYLTMCSKGKYLEMSCSRKRSSVREG